MDAPACMAGCARWRSTPRSRSWGTFVITLSFLILGVELLRPEGIVPAEEDVAGDLTNLFSGVWGSFGYWFLLIGIYVGFWDTVLTDQDGFVRLLGNGTQLILRAFGVSGRWTDSRFLMIFYLVVVLAIIPIAVFLWIGEPVPLLQFAGITEAVHIPIVTALILYLNQRALPKGLRASTPVFWVTVAAGRLLPMLCGLLCGPRARLDLSRGRRISRSRPFL
jgi:hypothetical protein